MTVIQAVAVATMKATIAGAEALLLAISRPAAVRFAFLVGIPTMFSAGGLQIHEAIKANQAVGQSIQAKPRHSRYSMRNCTAQLGDTGDGLDDGLNYWFNRRQDTGVVYSYFVISSQQTTTTA